MAGSWSRGESLIAGLRSETEEQVLSHLLLQGRASDLRRPTAPGPPTATTNQFVRHQYANLQASAETHSGCVLRLFLPSTERRSAATLCRGSYRRGDRWQSAERDRYSLPQAPSARPADKFLTEAPAEQLRPRLTD